MKSYRLLLFSKIVFFVKKGFFKGSIFFGGADLSALVLVRFGAFQHIGNLFARKFSALIAFRHTVFLCAVHKLIGALLVGETARAFYLII